MYKPNDNDDMDRLSREAAEHYNAPGVPSWDEFRKTLDKEMPQEKERKRRGFLFFFLLALGLSMAGSIAWYGIRMHKTVAPIDKSTTKKQDHSNGNTITVTDSVAAIENNKNGDRDLTAGPKYSLPSDTRKIAPANVNTSAGNSIETKSLKNKSATGHATDTPKPIAGNTLPLASSQKNIIASKAAAVHTLSSAVSTSKHTRTNHHVKNNIDFQDGPASYNVNASVLSKKRNTLLRKQQQDQTATTAAGGKKNKNNKNVNEGLAIKGKNTRAGSAEANNDIAQSNIDNENTGSDNNSTEPFTATDAVSDATENNTTPAAKDTVALIKPVVAVAQKKDSAKVVVAKKKNKSKKEKAILLGLTAGLDLSTVKFTYGSDLGYNIGFMGGYQFSKHWAAYTGIVYTKKNYKLNGGDYHPPDSYWTNWVNLQTVEGYCRMWELPLQARYTFNPAAKTAFFVSTGASSYFMKQQQYNYSYKTGTGTQNATWSDDKNINHIFSILDLSAGFEKQVGKHMNWQVEPYAKIPMVGVGFGSIKLSSFGVNLTIQYKHPVKR